MTSLGSTGQFLPMRANLSLSRTTNVSLTLVLLPPSASSKIHYGPQEIPILRKCIASSLAKLGHVRQIHDGKWLLKALLAPSKPYQEHISNINNFVWCFCVNYIPLNQVPRIIVYPIPSWVSAVHMSFGAVTYLWL